MIRAERSACAKAASAAAPSPCASSAMPKCSVGGSITGIALQRPAEQSGGARGVPDRRRSTPPAGAARRVAGASRRMSFAQPFRPGDILGWKHPKAALNCRSGCWPYRVLFPLPLLINQKDRREAQKNEETAAVGDGRYQGRWNDGGSRPSFCMVSGMATPITAASSAARAPSPRSSPTELPTVIDQEREQPPTVPQISPSAG